MAPALCLCCFLCPFPFVCLLKSYSPFRALLKLNVTFSGKFRGPGSETPSPGLPKCLPFPLRSTYHIISNFIWCICLPHQAVSSGTMSLHLLTPCLAHSIPSKNAEWMNLPMHLRFQKSLFALEIQRSTQKEDPDCKHMCV